MHTSGVYRLKEYTKGVEYELEGLCGKLFDLLDDHLMPKVDHVDARVFYLKVRCRCDGERGRHNVLLLVWWCLMDCVVPCTDEGDWAAGVWLCVLMWCTWLT